MGPKVSLGDFMKIGKLVYDDQVPGIEVEKAALGAKGTLDIVTFSAVKPDIAGLIKDLTPYDAIVTDYVPLTKEIISGLTKCKVISVAATGWTSVDVQACQDKGLYLCAIGEYCTQEVADHTLLLILSLQRRLMLFNHSVQVEKKWDWQAAPDIERVEGQTLGLIGLGKIGRAVAKRARAFGLEVAAHDPFLPKDGGADIGVKLLPLDDLLAVSDYVSVHMAVDQSNAGSFNYEKFAKMAKKPFFLNVSRGSAVIEADLVKALDEGLIRGAALDVLSTENPDLTTHPLVGRLNVILTPHIAFYSKMSMYLNSKISIDNAVYVMEGRNDLTNKIITGPK
jgi:D-3-phosphoglycerate dehydrogenase